MLNQPNRPQTAREIWAARRKLPFIPTFSPKLNAIIGGGLRSTGVYILTGAPGAGKCHRRDQGILMADGNIKKVQDIHIGDQLIGTDGYRTVLSTNTGVGEMFDIVPVKGKSWRVNKDHVLTLVRSKMRKFKREKVVDVSVAEWLTWSTTMRSKYKLLRSAVESFNTNNMLPLDPYFLGLLLGDGSLRDSVGVTTQDPEILTELKQQAAKFGLNITCSDEHKSAPFYRLAGKGFHTQNPITKILIDLGLRYTSCEDKYVPTCYKTTSWSNRLAMLAGLLDTDGHLTHNGFDFISKSKQLADDVAFLSRSIGLAAYVKECEKYCQTGGGGTYFRVSINGHCEIIPTRLPRKRATKRLQPKNVLHTGFEVIPSGTTEDFYGFTLDGDARYLLDDFTVTHNSSVSIDIADASINAGYPVVYVSAELTPQLVLARYAGKKLGMSWLETLDTEDPERLEIIGKFANDLGEYFWVLDPEQAKDATKWITAIHDWFMEANAENYKKQFGQEIPDDLRHVNMLVIVDYIQDLASTRMSQHRDQRAAVAELSRDFRNLAKDRFLPIWIISSSSRSHYASNEEQRAETLLASAKDSGEVEYDSTAVIHIRRRDSNDFKGLEFVVAKNRFGEAMQSIVFKLDPKTSVLEETDMKADGMAFKIILDKVGAAIYQAPGKYKSPMVIAKVLQLKASDVKKALDVFAAGSYGGIVLVITDGAYYLKAPTGN